MLDWKGSDIVNVNVNVARIAELLYEVHEGAVESQNCVTKRLTKRDVLRRWRKTGRDGDDWMSDGNDAATGNLHRMVEQAAA